MEQYRVLIVEDNRELARVLGAAIRSLGEEFEVAEVPSGEEGLLEIHREPYDVAIVDVILPGMDGIKFAKLLRKNLPDIKIILISGRDEEKLKKGAQEVNAQAWFTKPLEFADLLDTVERQLGLVESVLGDLPGLTTEEKRASHRISDLVSQLREQLNAQAVAILDEVGNITLQAGDFGDPHTVSKILPKVVAAYDAALKVTYQFTDEGLPKNYLAFESKSISLYAASVDYRYFLLVLCEQPCSSEEKTWLKSITETVESIRETLERLGVLRVKRIEPKVEISGEDEAEEAGEGDEEEIISEEVAPLLELLEEGVPLDEADEFWEEQAASAGLLSPVNPKALSYEQADKLGLVNNKDKGRE